MNKETLEALKGSIEKWRRINQKNGGPIEPTGPIVEECPVHIFDLKIFYSVEQHKINFKYKRPSKKSDLLEEINNDDERFSGKFAVI